MPGFQGGSQTMLTTAALTPSIASTLLLTSSGSVSATAQYGARIRRDAFTTLAVPSREEGHRFAEAIGHLAARSQVETRRMKWKVHPIGET